ncbi:MAG: NnrS family protein [Chthoniobacterales bacterium]
MSTSVSDPTNSATKASYWQLVAMGEPFRLLFPLGVLIGIFGVAIWPLYFWHLSSIYPTQIHARIMIQGFETCFVLGFLGTALPRLLDVPRLLLYETLFFAVCQVLITVFHYAGQPLVADSLFICNICFLLFTLGRRLRMRKDIPPPAFVLVLLGMASALTGSAMQVIWEINSSILPASTFRLSQLLLYQAYLLLPIMGVGAFILPRFFGLPSRQDLAESMSFTPEWKKRAAFALFCGVTVLVSLICESMGQYRLGYGLRIFAILLYFLREVPVYRASFNMGSMALALRIALVSIPIGYVLLIVWPEHLFALLHVVFISGFSLLTLVVSTRVMLGHSGKSHLLRAPLYSIRILMGLLFLAMLTRVIADWLPENQISHYIYAAVCWIIGVSIWGIAILPRVREPDTE